jgi:hypothetical protein
MSTAVVYLARQRDGLDATRAFVRSYAAFEAGLTHELVVILKGFADPVQRAAAVDTFSGVACRLVDVEEGGYDLGPYFTVARTLEHTAYVFLNTFSRILDGHWLAKYAAALGGPRVGLVGATASYESHRTAFEQAHGRWRFWGKAARARAFYRRHFEPFPNPHIRTNAFMIARETLRRVELPVLREKTDVYRFESGRSGLTRQIAKMGLEPVVVDRSGRSWMQDEWPISRTFRSGDEENLLVADNQTDLFLNAVAERRAVLSRLAWGV